MRVFISWSGEPSRVLAEAIQGWLEVLFAGRIEAFVSSQDIAKGDRGASVLAEELSVTEFGLLILTPNSAEAPWVNFEAGALSKSVDRARVVPLLVDMAEVRAGSPLAQFQRVQLLERSDVRRLVTELNRTLTETLPETSLDILFDHKWQAFEASVAECASAVRAPAPKRTESDLLQGIAVQLELVIRGQSVLADRIRAVEVATDAAKPKPYSDPLPPAPPAPGQSFPRMSQPRSVDLSAWDEAVRPTLGGS